MRRQEDIKRLVVNADDFGLDCAINQGIIQAYESGIVRSVSLMSCGVAFEEAVQLARRYPGLGVGVHLSLNEGDPVAASLLGKDERHFLFFFRFLLKFFSREINSAQIYLEFEAQINKFIEAGLRPTHLDGHKHIHMLPGILDVVLELARKFKIPSIRLSREPWLVSLKTSHRALKFLILSMIANIHLSKIRKHLIKIPDYCYGLTQSCRLNEEYLAWILKSLPVGTNELICHPGLSTLDLPNKNKEVELIALKSPLIKELIEDLGIQLIRYDEIR
ncbi:MAG: ChbG/HpnK family deacetylase [Candidatus Omnitrophica bacterium]|nr:ChbG/HpnK family deacetylase [Candidatus Omnitrophota bacterium]